MPDDPYSVLGVDPSADMADIRRAYLAHLRANHPDVRPGDDAAEERTRELNRAWAQIRTRRTGGVATDGQVRRDLAEARRRAADRRRAYSEQRRTVRVAFTAATLRIALAVVVLGFVLLAAFAR